MEAGKAIPVDLLPSIVEGVSGVIESGTMTWPLVRDRVDCILTVSEAEIRAAMLWMLENQRQVVEPSGVLAIAGALRYAEQLAGRRSVAVVTDANVSSARYLKRLKEVAA